ncbi:hypothetical protein [Dyella nitratireducens]|uniref:Uncharacterized protein n=1 Tax=Dyella nitratireducens TaxID=1849580 RepID=A0ABQ1FU67_9GAMM|nr:hypothetical protein [Dyella nitratireducens]GGA29898.1 hypothetical protein GCM10010981_18580 [Dyella nitratireducens]GLQ43078.1 hypothetical protein GCM10007902_29280 [Dyella nitratireducens]
MIDTLDLLEAIGRDASLRHASTEELTSALVQAQASEALTAAVASGDSSRLFEEFGHMQNEPPQSGNHPFHEEEPDEEQPLEVPVPEKTPPPSEN